MAEPVMLITGASGNVGRELIRCLSNAGESFWTGGRRPVDGLPWRFLDFHNPASMQAALSGVRKLFLVRPPEMANVRQTLIPMLRQARRAGVEQVVFLSLQGAQANPLVPHYQVEQAIRALGLGHTFLRAGFFMQNLSTVHREEIARAHELRVPAGEGTTAFVDCRDLAAAACLTLTRPGHLNRAYELTGAEALSYARVAELLSAELGRPIRYTRPSLPAFVLQGLRQGRALPYTLVMGAIYSVARLGKAGHVSDTLGRLLGRPPLTMAEFIRDYRHCWLMPAETPA